MREDIFTINTSKYTLADYMNFNARNRENLGKEIPVTVYRLMEYSLRDEIFERFGKDTQISVFRNAGFKAGQYFAQYQLDMSLPFNEFVAQLQSRLIELKIGLLRIEKVEEETGKIILSIAEDADCSGLPLLGETVCNYDEGFISGILSAYSKKDYRTIETDCWATGDRVCRFRAEIKEQ
jgi:hypothetical protein